LTAERQASEALVINLLLMSISPVKALNALEILTSQ
jgi:hypothetical protein